MPDRAAVKLVREQLIIMQLLDEQAADVRASLFPGVRHFTLHELRTVLRVVYIGHFKGRSLSTAAIARRAGIPRATVARRLVTLARMGLIEQVGNTYGMPVERVNAERHQAFVERSVRRIIKACALLTQT